MEYSNHGQYIEMITLNHKDRVYSDVPRKNVLRGLLLEDRKDVLFVGEGNFTFTVAFAALRRHESGGDPWSGICSTRYENKSLPKLSEVKALCVQHCVQQLLSICEKEIEEEIEELPDVPNSWAWERKIDACNIPLRLVPSAGVIWFQCPWSDRDSTNTLIQTFLLETAPKLDKESYVCIGITKLFPYIKSYSLEDILGEDLRAEDDSTEVLRKYKFCGADEQLIKKILKFGYRHEGCTREDIHEKIRDYHVTLVFKKKASSSSQSSPEPVASSSSSSRSPSPPPAKMMCKSNKTKKQKTCKK